MGLSALTPSNPLSSWIQGFTLKLVRIIWTLMHQTHFLDAATPRPRPTPGFFSPACQDTSQAYSGVSPHLSILSDHGEKSGLPQPCWHPTQDLGRVERES